MKVMIQRRIMLAWIGGMLGVLPMMAGELNIRPGPFYWEIIAKNPAGFTNVIQSAGNLATNAVWTDLIQYYSDGQEISIYDDAAGAGIRYYRVITLAPFAAPSKMAWIPPGLFMMGTPASEALRDTNEVMHKVTLTKGFFIGQYEVTQGEYQAIIGSNPSTSKKSTNQPVETLTWAQATNYCAKFTEQERNAGRLPTGWIYRLPTEAEWEYACRGGTPTAFHHGNAIAGTNANFYTYYEYDAAIGDIYIAAPSYLGRSRSVGAFVPNAFGLYDMHGNVLEWCQDWFDNYPAGEVIDPKGAATGTLRVSRGGSWRSNGSGCRSGRRLAFTPDSKSYFQGFRMVMAME